MRRVRYLPKNWRMFSTIPLVLPQSVPLPASVSPTDVLKLIILIPRAPHLLAAEALAAAATHYSAQHVDSGTDIRVNVDMAVVRHLMSRTIRWTCRSALIRQSLIAVGHADQIPRERSRRSCETRHG